MCEPTRPNVTFYFVCSNVQEYSVIGITIIQLKTPFQIGSLLAWALVDGYESEISSYHQ